jgi:hypothetical protein
MSDKPVEIVERWKGKHQRLVVLSNGSKAQRRYAASGIKLIEELSTAEARVKELERQLAAAKVEHRKEMIEMQKEMSQSIREAAEEARWEARQGEDYGSY